MMKLSTMRALIDTLNDEWESPIADQLLSMWEHDAGRAKFFRASANFLFVFRKAGKQYYLRFNHASERSIELIQAELDYLRFLSTKGLTIAKPVPSINGRFIESVPTALGIFHAVVFEGLLGKQLEFEELTSENFIQWGQALGEFHYAAQGYRAAGRPGWKERLTTLSAYLPETEHATQASLMLVQEKLAQIPVGDGNYGLIHFDFELDNLIWNGGQAGIIDFDDCTYCWFAADIAFALRDLFDDRPENVDLRSESFQSFMSGYRLAREISPEELEWIPLFLRLHNLITFIKLHRTLGVSESQDEPDWLVELRAKLSRKMQFYRDGFSHAVDTTGSHKNERLSAA